MIAAIKWEDDKLSLLDQRVLPGRVEYVTSSNFRDTAKAITDMVVRGAPAIGIAGAYGMALAALECDSEKFLESAAQHLIKARPTAVNLEWAVKRVLNKILETPGQARLVAIEEARKIELEDIETNKKIGEYGAELLGTGSRVLTHCNAGALATGGFGTALAVIRKAWEEGKIECVYADETRPFLQGARLTAWELLQDGIDVTLLVDSAAGYLMSLNKIDAIIVGADRIALNGDVANKIGTYGLACLAKHHGIKFYVAAPVSTFDLSIKSGKEIPIEERPSQEVLEYMGKPIAPKGAKAFNPSFDVSPASLISAIITEKGVIYPPYSQNIPRTVA